MSVCLQNKPLSTCPRGHNREERLEMSVYLQNTPKSLLRLDPAGPSTSLIGQSHGTDQSDAFKSHCRPARSDSGPKRNKLFLI